MTTPATLQLVEEHDHVVPVLRCIGEIDVATVGLLRERIQNLLIDGSAHLVLDLDPVTFIDSLGLGSLIGAHKRARVLQGSLVIICTTPSVLRVLAATALDRVFTVVSSLDDALAS